MFTKALLPAMLLAATTLVHAQQPAGTPIPAAQQAPALSPEQQAALAKQNQAILQIAQRTAQMIDQNQADQVWDGASDIAKKAAPKDVFVKQIANDRQALGALTARTAQGITRRQSAGGPVPAGQYVSVSFATRFAKFKQPIRELVTFHLDADHVWRLAGYTVH